MEEFYNIEEQRHWNNPGNWKDSVGEDHTGEIWNLPGGIEVVWEMLDDTVTPYCEGRVLEIAPGFGRITELILNKFPDLSSFNIIDMNELCISECVKRFGNKISGYHVNDGKSLPFKKGSFDFILSYDSFVHMHLNVVKKYLEEISKVLRIGGHATIHHSMLFDGTDLSFDNLGGRANMRYDEMLEKARSVGLIPMRKPKYFVAGPDEDGIIEETSTAPVPDAITVFKKI